MPTDITLVQIPHLNKTKSYYEWIKVGYGLFAQEGPEGIQIERLARILNLNKSGFYHYFGNHDTYFDHLMQYHFQQIDLMTASIQSIDQFELGFAQLLAEFSIPVLVQKQLQRASHHPVFARTYKDVNNKLELNILPLWADFIEMTENPTLALRYLEFVQEIFYTRVTPQTLNVKFILDFCVEAKEICDGFKNSYSDALVVKQMA